jgi:NAD(P)H dehydrogenase (quinone)
MKASVILAHPYQQSLNHAFFHRICATLCAKSVTVFGHDLYKENFNPLLTAEELEKKKSSDKLVIQYVGELLDSNVLFFIHPNWWGQPPAILTGYINRVIRAPYAFEFPPGDKGVGIPTGKLTDKYGVVINTSNTEKTREETVFNDPLEHIWMKCILEYCGISKHYRKTFRIVANSTLEERLQWLDEVEDIVVNSINCCDGGGV